jgi:eukaryotic-like serine/threonine-protein kinase
METAATVALAADHLIADRYEVLDLLGEGGMGAVYRVRDRELGEIVALKTLKAEVAESEGGLERFRREAKLARRVTHPNVARTFDVGTHEGVRFLTMELIEGEPLSRTLSRGPCALPESLRIGAEIARGLAAAHAVGVVHRDLKPDNVMVSGARVVITDFGIARQTGVIGDAAHSVGIVLGTPAYMAPEQVEARELDGRADIYALGIVLYQMLTGELPFAGDTPFAMAAARLHGDIPDPAKKDPSLPPAIVALVRSALARKREDRPDAQAILERLDELRAGRFDTPVALPSSRLEGTSIAVVPFTGDATIAGSLSEAVADALCALRGARVVAPGSIASSAHTRDGVLDAASVARATETDWVVSGSVRLSGELARISTRLFDARRKAQAWSDKIDMAADPFAIEDRVVARIADALRERAEGQRRTGPSDPVAAEIYRRARGLYFKFMPGSVAEAVLLLEDAHTRFPRDPWITGALAAALVRSWMFQHTTDRAAAARAEDMALRALADDPSRGEALLTIGIIRWQFGELPAAARAFEDAIARTPQLAEAHEYLAQMLAESGHVDAALRHLDIAGAIDPDSRNVMAERLRILELMGEHERVDREVAVALLRPEIPDVAKAFMAFRFAIWRRDVGPMVASADRIRRFPERERQYYLPLAESVVAALRSEPCVDVPRQRADSPHASLRRRSYFYQLSTELQILVGDHAAALDSLEKAAEVLLFDVLWLDRCPLLAPLRDDPRYARVRGICGARAL